jgi:hypothetical protein
MAFFAHPVVRLSYFPSLDYKPRSAFGIRLLAGSLTAAKPVQIMANPPLMWIVCPVT